VSNLQFASDLLDDALFRAGERTDGNSDYEAAALRYLNRAYFAICLGGRELVPDVQEDWWWLRKHPPGVLTLLPVITTGTVNVANNATGITFSSAPARDLDNWFFKVDTHEDVFRISDHTAAVAAATLDSVYTGPDDAAATYKAFKLEYDLASDVLRPISPMRAFRAERMYEIVGVDALALDRDYPVALADSGMPDRFAMVDEDTVRFNRYGGVASTELIRVEYDYLYRPSVLTDASVEPVLPWQWRSILADFTTGWLMQDKNDDRAGGVLSLAQSGLQAMALENRHKMAGLAAQNFGAIRPRQDIYQRQMRGPLRTSSGLVIG
jgi:hypothetical protein